MKKPITLSAAFIPAVCLVVCCGASIYSIMPFGTPMFAALSAGAFIGILAPIYVAASFLFTFEVWRLYTAALSVFIIAIRTVLSLKWKRLDCEAARTCFSLGAVAAECALSAAFTSAASAVISAAVGFLFYYFAKIFAVEAERRFSSRPSKIECFSTCVVLFAAGLCFGRAKTAEINVGLIFAFFTSFLMNAAGLRAFGATAAIGVGLSFGLGAETSLCYIAGASAAALFDKLPRFVGVFVGVGIFAALSVLLGVPPLNVGMNSLFAAAGGLPVFVAPRRAVRALRSYFDFDGCERIAVRHYINRTRSDAGNKMLALSSVFDETARLMNGMRDPAPDFAALGAALEERFCRYCTECGACGNRSEVEKAFTDIAERAYSGESVIYGVPEFFNASCVRAAEVVSAASEISDGAKTRAVLLKSEKDARAAIAERLFAVSDVLNKLGVSQSSKISFDGDAEDRIITELGLSGVECADAFVADGAVTAIVRSIDSAKQKTTRAVSLCMKKPYELVSLEKTSAAGWSVATLKKKATYEAAYARAGVSKSGGVSGDNYTFERIGDRFLVALADGMGSGEEAGDNSSAAVELIECFYRAGFDSTSALSGVNRFLKVGAESYSAADVAVCNLETAQVDIIKIGSPPCFIKTEDTVLKIEGRSLPIGVLDEMRPYVTAKKMYPGQMLILVTDGVSDCFSGDELPEYINGLPSHNPEAIASAVLSRALELVKEPRDDMTVVAFRLYKASSK